MSQNCLICDLDDTLRKPKLIGKFFSNPDQFELIREAIEVLEYYRANNWLIVGATNQGSVGTGFTLDGVLCKRTNGNPRTASIYESDSVIVPTLREIDWESLNRPVIRFAADPI